jgi:N-acetylglucosaminyl-diphospho-decaprenol L-rhamnosyltransferase
MPANYRDVEISISNTNNRDLLRRCLASLAAACEGLTWRATLVDNASEDGSLELVESEFPWVRVLRNETRQGFAVNHNRVLRPAVEDRLARYVLVQHEDIELAAVAVRMLIEFCDADPRVGAAGPLILDPDGKPMSSFRPYPRVRRALWLPFRPGAPPPHASAIGWLDGPCTLYRVEALREVGTLDERFFIFFEDADLCLRLHRAGWTCELYDAARVVHRRHSSVGQPSLANRMERELIRSRYLYFCKHHGRAAAAAVTVAGQAGLFTRGAKAFAGGLVRRDSKELAHGNLLLSLAAYRPTTSLPHQRPAPGGSE